MAMLLQNPLYGWLRQSRTFISVGILGGMIIFLLITGLTEVWKFPISFKASLGAFFAFQIIIIFPIILLVLGGLIARSLGPLSQNPKDVIIAGALSGLVTAFSITLFIGIRNFFFSGIPDTITFIGHLTLAFICSIILQATGAFFWFRWNQRNTTNSGERNTFWSGKKSIILSIIFIIVILIPLIVLPPSWAYDSIQSGSIEREWWYVKWDRIVANQTASDTLLLTLYLQEDPLIDHYWKKPYCVITLDGKEITNQSIMRYQGIADTIDPPEGLSFSQHSSVVLKGPDFDPVRNPTGHLEVYKIIPYRMGDEKFILLDYWIGKKGEGK